MLTAKIMVCSFMEEFDLEENKSFPLKMDDSFNYAPV
jgi:hypothetical protein